MLGTVLTDAVLHLVQGRAGWTQETVGPGSGHYCLLLPTHPYYYYYYYYYSALMHTLFPHKLATTNPLLLLPSLLQCTLKAPILLNCTSKYLSYNATNPLPLALAPQH